MGFLKNILPVAGSAIGSYFGGPMGGQIGGGIGSMLGGSGGGKNFNNPYNSASPYLQAIPGMAREAYNPFIEQGQRSSAYMPEMQSTYKNMYDNSQIPAIYQQAENMYANNPTGDVYSSMGQDPKAFINSIMKDYNPSEGYKFKEGRMLGAARNAAAQGGFAGTPYAQEEQADLVRGLLGGDMQEWLSNVLGVQGSGLSGGERMMEGRERAMGNRAQMAAQMLQGRERGLQHEMQGHQFREERGYGAADNLINALMQSQIAQGGAAAGSQNLRNSFDTQRRNQMAQNVGGMGQGLGQLFGQLGKGAPFFGGGI
jgi:hypothetical protein